MPNDNPSMVESQVISAPLPSFNIEIERNSKGFNWKFTILNVHNADEADTLRVIAIDQIGRGIADGIRMGQHVGGANL